MNKIEKLIEEFCPQGVEFRALGEVLDYEQPTKYIVSSTKYNDDFTMPVLTAGQSFILGYTDEIEGIYNADKQNAVIIFDDFTTAFHWVDFNFKVKSSAMKMIRPQQHTNIDFRFVYFAMRCIGYQPQDHARHWISKYSKIKIPIPPLTIQKEIVKILDNFTQLEGELEAELEARKKQYEYYREALLSFGDDVEFRALGEVCEKTLNIKWQNNKEQFQYIDLTSVDRSRNIITETKMITSATAPSRAQKIVKTGDVIFGTTRPTLKRFCIINNKYNEQICSTGFCVLRPNTKMVLTNYIFHFISSSCFYDYTEKNQKGASYPAISDTLVNKFKIPIPPLSKQKEIVAILDKFDALVNDISTGLPAEIAARKKQYEYYRNQLLEFRVKSYEL